MTITTTDLTFTAIVALFLLACLQTVTSAQTFFPDQVSIQSDAEPQAALAVSRVGLQPSALDLFTNGGGDQIRFFGATSEGNFLRSYFNDQGAFYSNAWMVISGELSNLGSLTPVTLAPTNDSFMLGIWSDVPGPAVVVRPNSNSVSDPVLTTMDLFGDYRFVVQPDGSLQFAGLGTNDDGNGMGVPFASTNFDTTLHRVGPGQLRTEGTFSAQNYAVNLLNESGGTVAAAIIATISSLANDAFTVSSVDSDPSVAGVVLTNVPTGVEGPIIVHGIAQVSVVAPVQRGNLLVSAGNGSARSLNADEVPPIGAIIGKAVMQTSVASGSIQNIDVLVNVN